MGTQVITSVSLPGWKAYKEFVDALSGNWAFRGQGNACWQLNNAVERTDFIRLHRQIEADFLAEFQRGARNYLSRDEIPSHTIEWLALMQHHGAPTRLLDFSWSPYIAAFFAFELCHLAGGSHIAVWAVNMAFLKTKSVALLAQLFGDSVTKTKNGINEQLFDEIFFQNKSSIVFPVEPFRMNRRYSLQQSVFVSTGNSYEPFMKQLEFLGEDLGRAVVRIEVPVGEQKAVLRDLQRMNLNRASLFPDLDGYAASLRLRYNSMRTPEELMQAQLQSLEDKDFRFLP
ncbi:FRG domain-containing protein [Pseudocnuella soli]|uniref:FRG domain-containing protein n=1 Tax=Pseudocnuella soli TaxID=2502779 RepID=UPI00104F69D7|nr:FRG domain-containing protein [Pseudocnuella soli]